MEKKKISKIKGQREYKIEIPKTKFELVNQILCRWWYGMKNPYADQEVSFEKELNEKQLILVDQDGLKSES